MFKPKVTRNDWGSGGGGGEQILMRFRVISHRQKK